MAQIQKTLTLTVDEQVFAVDQMSQSIQQLIVMFDDWRQKELDAQSDLLLTRAGLRDLQREIYSTIMAEREAAAAEAAKSAANDAATDTEFVPVNND